MSDPMNERELENRAPVKTESNDSSRLNVKLADNVSCVLAVYWHVCTGT